jgi:triacylglycerol lipase
MLPPAIPYDPSAEALFHPEKRPPLAMAPDWPADALAAELCRLAYIRFEQGDAQKGIIASAVGAIGYSDLEFFTGGVPGEPDLGGQAFAAVNDRQEAVIAFRGTQSDSLMDILADARFLTVPWRGEGRVHQGFWMSLESLLPQIEQWLDTRPISRLTITGHSLGAAMASLLAALKPEAQLVTIGCPRVGDRVFGASFGGSVPRRYVDTLDVVPQVPPAIGYAHLGALFYIDALGQVHPPGGTAPFVADQLRARRDYLPLVRPGNAASRGLADHAPINYVSAMLGVRTGP